MQASDHAAAKRAVGRAMLQGWAWREAVQAAGVQMSRATAYRLRQRMLAGGEEAVHDRRQGHASKVCGAVRAWLEGYYPQHPHATGKAVQALLEEQSGVRVSVTHLNRLRAAFTSTACGGKNQPGIWQDGAGGLLLLAAAEASALLSTLEAIPLIRSRRGQPCRPKKLHADKGYDYAKSRQACLARGITPRLARRGIETSEKLGQYRSLVERTLAWLSRFRRLKVRYERRADIHQAFLSLGCSLICWQALQKAFC